MLDPGSPKRARAKRTSYTGALWPHGLPTNSWQHLPVFPACLCIMPVPRLRPKKPNGKDSRAVGINQTWELYHVGLAPLHVISAGTYYSQVSGQKRFLTRHTTRIHDRGVHDIRASLSSVYTVCISVQHNLKACGW